MKKALLLILVAMTSKAFTSDKYPLALKGFYERISADSNIINSITCPPYTTVDVKIIEKDIVLATYTYLERKSDDPRDAVNIEISNDFFGETGHFDSRSIYTGNRISEYRLIKLDKKNSDTLIIEYGGILSRNAQKAGTCRYRRL